MSEMSLVLVVEDNPTNLKLVVDVLTFEGFRVMWASDAVEARDVLAHVTPDLVLMDLQIPGVDGLTLTRQLKADARWRQIPIVALTAFALTGDEEKAYAAGCDGYITKPFDVARLAEQLSGFLRNPARS